MPAHTRMLLHLRPDYALVRMLNDENNRKFPPTLFSFGMPASISATDPTLTKIRFIANRHKADDNYMLPYSGEIDFTYHRVDLTDQFVAILNGFRPSLPTSTQVLLNEITRITGIEFFPDDIVLEDITRSNSKPYVIKAKVESQRFVGQLEVELIDVFALSDYFQDNLTAPSFSFPAVPTLRSMSINNPFINATPLIGTGLLKKFEDRSWSFDYSNLGTLLRKTVPQPGRRIDQLPLVSWINQPSPTTWNYAQAEVTVHVDQSSPHIFTPKLNRLIRVELNEDKITNLDDMEILIPYYRFNELESAFDTEGRMRLPTTFNLTNATPWNKKLSGLEVGEILSPPDFEILNFEIIPGEIWNFWPERNPLNLRNAVVQYNGEIQRFMTNTLDPTLNRVIVVTLSDYNTVYSGNFFIFYRSPINLNVAIGALAVDVETDFDFSPVDGTAPYTITLHSGELAPGHSIVDGHLTGTPVTTGDYNGMLLIVDSDDVVAYQTFNYSVV